MSALGSVLNSALKSMAANQLALSVASNNLANAQNVDYTRQRLVTAPAGSSGDLLGIGTGVEVLGVSAVRDLLIESRLSQAISAKAGDEALTQSLSNVEALFTDTEDSGLLFNLTNFFNSFHALSRDPASTNARDGVKISAQSLINAFHARHRDLTKIQNTANKAVTAGIDEVNRLAAEIAGLTEEINFQSVTNDANDLRDRRAGLVKELATLVELNELESGGEYQLTTKDNQLLVLNGTVQTLTAATVTAGIGNGTLKAAIDVRDQNVPKYIDALDQLAHELSTQVNAIHAGAYNLDGETDINFFSTLTGPSGASRLIGLSAEVFSDSRKISASALPAGNDNTAALQLGNLLHEPVFTDGSITDQYRSLVFSVGTDIATAQSGFREHEALENQLQNRRQSISGVSIDEETALILQFQRAYEASARLVRAVDEMLQVALGIGA